MIDLYSTLDWSVLCTEVTKLRITRVERGKVVGMPLAKASAGREEPGENLALATPAA